MNNPLNHLWQRHTGSAHSSSSSTQQGSGGHFLQQSVPGGRLLLSMHASTSKYRLYAFLLLHTHIQTRTQLKVLTNPRIPTCGSIETPAALPAQHR
jgi:hypothetical protein